jgi:catechol 2,3-dioxygenase-like lactoylglutathione lyase family enzyme
MPQTLTTVRVVTLFVEDEQRSKQFYERVFGVAPADEGHGTVIFQLDNLFLRLLRRDEAEREMLGGVKVGDARSGATAQLAFFVEDADAVCGELVDRGIEIAYGPVDRPWGVRVAGFVDPDGHVLQFGSNLPAA